MDSADSWIECSLLDCWELAVCCEEKSQLVPSTMFPGSCHEWPNELEPDLREQESDADQVALDVATQTNGRNQTKTS